MLIRLVISILLLLVVSRFVDAGDVLSRLATMSASWVAAALAISIVQVGTSAWRWR